MMSLCGLRLYGGNQGEAYNILAFPADIGRKPALPASGSRQHLHAGESWLCWQHLHAS